MSQIELTKPDGHTRTVCLGDEILFKVRGEKNTIRRGTVDQIGEIRRTVRIKGDITVTGWYDPENIYYLDSLPKEGQDFTYLWLLLMGFGAGIVCTLILLGKIS